MNRTLERYLKQATRGLHGSVKKDVWNELEGDILERVRGSRAFGLSEGEAMKQALKQLGSAQEMSAGMVKTYRLPLVQKTLIGFSVVGLLMLSFPSNAQPLVSLTHWGESLEVSPDELIKSLQNQGLVIKESQTDSANTKTQLTLPNGKLVWIEPANSFRPPESRGAPSLLIKPILQNIHSAGYPIKISGWEKLKGVTQICGVEKAA